MLPRAPKSVSVNLFWLRFDLIGIQGQMRSQQHGLSAIGSAELAHDRRHMGFDDRLGDLQLVGDACENAPQN
jgi:hypothetical protein